MNEPLPIETAPKRERILMWRKDSKIWEIGRVAPEYFGNKEYAYTHWLPLPDAVLTTSKP